MQVLDRVILGLMDWLIDWSPIDQSDEQASYQNSLWLLIDWWAGSLHRLVDWWLGWLIIYPADRFLDWLIDWSSTGILRTSHFGMTMWFYCLVDCSIDRLIDWQRSRGLIDWLYRLHWSIVWSKWHFTPQWRIDDVIDHHKSYTLPRFDRSIDHINQSIHRMRNQRVFRLIGWLMLGWY